MKSRRRQATKYAAQNDFRLSRSSFLQNLSETAFQALLYNKFASAAEPIRVLTFELERRAQTDPNEYGALLAECYATWFSVRNSILSATVAEEIRRMDPYGTDLVSLVCS